MTTRRTRSLLAALAVVPAAVATTVAGCGDGPAPFAPAPPPSPAAKALVGTWRTTAEPVLPQGSWQQTLVVRSDMRVEHEGAMYGLYPADEPQTLSASTTVYGWIGATATRFVIHPDSAVMRDRFYGAGYRRVDRDLPDPSPADSTSYEVRNGVLTLTFYSYPADAPVLTTAVYYRVK